MEVSVRLMPAPFVRNSCVRRCVRHCALDYDTCEWSGWRLCIWETKVNEMPPDASCIACMSNGFCWLAEEL